MRRELNELIIFIFIKKKTGTNSELLMKLSTEDISISFFLQKKAILNHSLSHNTWYKSGIIVDLTCSQTSYMLPQVKIHYLKCIYYIFYFINI